MISEVVSDADTFENDNADFGDIGTPYTENDLNEYHEDENEFADIEPANLDEEAEVALEGKDILLEQDKQQEKEFDVETGMDDGIKETFEVNDDESFDDIGILCNENDLNESHDDKNEFVDIASADLDEETEVDLEGEGVLLEQDGQQKVELDLETEIDDEIEIEDVFGDLGKDFREEDPELEEDVLEKNTADIIRKLTEQNVTDSILPKTHGHWQDEDMIGNSKWILDDDAEISWKKGGETHSITGRELKEKYGIEGVDYSGNEPDFEPFEDKMIGHVELEDFPDQRTGKSGTYAYATKAAADKLGLDEHEIEKYMEENGLTWHECGDRRTVRAIPTEINTAFKHTGGIGIEKSLKAMSEELGERYGDMALQRVSHEGMVSSAEMESAINSIQQRFRDRKRGK